MDKIETLEDLRQQHQERLRHTPPSPLSPKMKRIPMLTLGELLGKDRRQIELSKELDLSNLFRIKLNSM